VAKYLYTLILYIAIIGASAPVLAQTTYGFRIGANVGTLSGTFADEPSSALGLVAGSFVHSALRNDLGLQFEVLYSQKGARFEPTSVLGERFERRIQGTYLEIPLLLAYAPSWRSSLRPVLYAGGAVGFEISERIRDRLGSFEQSEESDDLRSPDLGAVLSLDLVVPAGSLDALLGLRYTHGLRDLANPDVGPETEVFSRTFAVTVGFLF
jgi:hypothetical protein